MDWWVRWIPSEPCLVTRISEFTQVIIIHGKKMFKKIDDHRPYFEYLAKSGYKPEMEYKSLVNFQYLWLRTKNQI
jgi:hypothetical protein